MQGAHVVVVSSAVQADNVEVVEAHRLKIPVIPRAEMLAELMRLKYGIAVAGAHGKTTTTSMVAAVLAAADLDPTFVVGGRVNHAGANAGVGQGDYMVVEADESDRSFLLLAPVIAVVTTIDREHLDQYSSLEEIQEIFLQFANRVPFYGSVILCLDEPNVQAILPRVKRPVMTYGTSSQADLVISDVKLKGLSSEFRLKYHGEDLGIFRLPAPPGIHNVRNAAAAAAVGLVLNVPPDLIRDGLANFRGVGRRFEIKGEFSGVTLIDDYGHHPAEIRATLEAARGCGYKRLLVLFQPHRYTRTQFLWEDFRRSFNQADILVITDIYAAGEQPIEGVTGEHLADSDQLGGHKNVVYSSTLQGGIEYMLREARPGDAVLTIGAGSVRTRDRRAGDVARFEDFDVSCGLTTKRRRVCGSSVPNCARESRLRKKLRSESAARPTKLLLQRHETIPDVMRLLADESIPHRFLGGGTNVLVADGELPWVVLHLPTVEARHASRRQRGVRGRGGRSGRHGDVLREARSGRHGRPDRSAWKRGRGAAHECGRVRHADRSARARSASSIARPRAKLKRCAASEIRFDYRHTSFAPDDLMLRVKLELPSKPYKEIIAAIKVCNEKRRASQPLNQKSAGCIFKNPPGGFGGQA